MGRRGFTLFEMLVVIGATAAMMTSLALIATQARRARVATQARIAEIDDVASAVSTLTEDIRRASHVPVSYGADRTGAGTLVLVSEGQVVVYTCGADGLVRRRTSADGTSGSRTLLPPGTEASFAFPDPGRRWVEVTLHTELDRKRKRPAYIVFAGLRGRP